VFHPAPYERVDRAEETKNSQEHAFFFKKLYQYDNKQNKISDCDNRNNNAKDDQ